MTRSYPASRAACPGDLPEPVIKGSQAARPRELPSVPAGGAPRPAKSQSPGSSPAGGRSPSALHPLRFPCVPAPLKLGQELREEAELRDPGAVSSPDRKAECTECRGRSALVPCSRDMAFNFGAPSGTSGTAGATAAPAGECSQHLLPGRRGGLWSAPSARDLAGGPWGLVPARRLSGLRERAGGGPQEAAGDSRPALGLARRAGDPRGTVVPGLASRCRGGGLGESGGGSAVRGTETALPSPALGRLPPRARRGWGCGAPPLPCGCRHPSPAPAALAGGPPAPASWPRRSRGYPVESKSGFVFVHFCETSCWLFLILLAFFSFSSSPSTLLKFCLFVCLFAYTPIRIWWAWDCQLHRQWV